MRAAASDQMYGAALAAIERQFLVGELVCIEPIPSMPLYFWGDTNNKRYISSYFDAYPDNFDGTGRGPVWRHGDWLKVTSRGTCIIYGRSDANSIAHLHRP
jgi:acetoacetyl-CoA synthetase